MTDYRIESVTKEEWAERALRAEATAMKASNAALLEKRRADKAEAKLAKAVEALSEIAKPKTGPDFDWSEEEADRWRAGWYRKYERIARTTLAELKGEDRG